MDSALRNQLELLADDFAKVEGERFTHFYCPVLFVDEPAELCKAHVVNRALQGASGAWTVQRADVDSFYGRAFESEFIALEYARGWSAPDALTNKKVNRALRPKLTVDGEQVEHFVAQQPVPESFAALGIGHRDGSMAVLGVKMSEDRLSGSLEKQWAVEIDRDLRIPALVSLIKAAYLTKFRLHGYKYALSAAGHLIGRQILGEFFLENCHLPDREARQRAPDFFRPYQAMVRPVLSLPADASTVDDQQIQVCWGASGKPWATVVFVRTGELTHAVMMPVSDRPEAIATYLDFMQNDNEEISVRAAQFLPSEARWDVSPTEIRVRWPKRGFAQELAV